MELKEFFQVFRSHYKVFWTVVIACFFVLGMILWFTPQWYVSTLTLTVVRSQEKVIGDVNEKFPVENFGSYYRIEADNTFGETVVAWLHTPQIVQSIRESMSDEKANEYFGKRGLTKHYTTKQRSSHVIDAIYRSSSHESANEEARAIIAQLNKRTSALNQDISKVEWFQLVAEKPYVENFAYNLALLLAITTMMALCLGVMSVLIYHYIR